MAKAPKNLDAADRRDYLVLTPIQHDLEPFEPGDKLALTEAEAAPLLKVGAVTDKPTKAQIASLIVNEPDDDDAGEAAEAQPTE